LLREQPIRIGHNREVTGVAVTPDGTRIVTGSLDDTARIWDRTSGRELAVLEDAESWVLSVAVSPDGARIVTGSDDGNARIWDSASGKLLTILRGHTGRINRVVVTSSGSKIATTPQDNTIQVWDAAVGRQLSVFGGYDGQFLGAGLAVIPDNSRIIVTSPGNSATVFDLVTGNEIVTLLGPQREVTSVAVTPDGARIVTGSFDSTTRVWDARTGKQLLVLKSLSGTFLVARVLESRAFF